MPESKFKNMGDFSNANGPGLDPIQTSSTMASVQGVFLRRLFTFNLRTRNPFSLFVMLLFGVVVTGFMLFAIYAAISTRAVVKLDWLDFLMLGLFYLLLGIVLSVGLALIINFLLNIGIIIGFIGQKSNIGREKKRSREKTNKKMPKRRKDFK
ncbi:MAG: hypothetical protein ABIU06_05695 [Anaerolineales bacterium]